MSFQIQQKIKQNAQELRSYVTDLYGWEEEMELKEKTKNKLRKQDKARQEKEQKQNEPPPRKSREEPPQEDEKPVEKKKDLIRDVNTVRDYYKAWDKYDVDKELKKLEEEEQRAYKPYNPYEDSKNNLRAKPKVKMNVQARRTVVTDPNALKDKGNLHFQSLEYDKAISCYSECLDKLKHQAEGKKISELSENDRKLRCVVLSNRAMTFLKINETVKALEDASLSLEFNEKYSKSYYRRAECLKKLGRYKQSLKDYEMVGKLEPGETKAAAQAKRIKSYLARRCRQFRQGMVMEYNQSLMGGSSRIVIDETDELGSLEAAAAAQQLNYLEEL